MDGVYSTRSIWAGHKEVVHVTFDPDVIDYQSLLTNAKSMECASTVFTYNENQQRTAIAANVGDVVRWRDSLQSRRVRKSEQKFYLRNTPYGYLPLNELQAVKLNSAVSPPNVKNSEPEKLLSPRQAELLVKIKRALRADPQSLAGLGFPEDQRALVDYHQQLTKRLAELEK